MDTTQFESMFVASIYKVLFFVQKKKQVAVGCLKELLVFWQQKFSSPMRY